MPLAGLPHPQKLKRPNLAISNFKKGQILKNEKRSNKGQNFFKYFFAITRFKVGIKKNIASFAQISPEQALKYTIFVNIPKWPKKAKTL